MESLLYRVFVSIDEHSTVQDLAQVLDTKLELVTLALSLFCRLGFAHKKTADSLQDKVIRAPSFRPTCFRPTFFVKSY